MHSLNSFLSAVSLMITHSLSHTHSLRSLVATMNQFLEERHLTFVDTLLTDYRVVYVTQFNLKSGEVQVIKSTVETGNMYMNKKEHIHSPDGSVV